ncbi:carbohydrate ABC transporter membrane protein 2 CUT1 family (TC 3.A.1.1.-) [Ruminococcus sp. CAG:55]|nr:carbohydrate ABC transporter membrane protein 2 CUT1 family (TC 3.A.1.1.-) [Ruminococcus sp. CAG:55]
MNKKVKHGTLLTVIFTVLSLLYLYPIVLVFINSFKKKAYISKAPFEIPTGKMYVGLENYIRGIKQTGLIQAFGWSLFITILSVAVIILCCSMCAWYICRVKTKFTKVLYMLCLFAMIVPFQMEMFTLSKIANMLHMGNPWGLIVIYLGFGAGLSVFMFTGFMKSIPLEIEEAAMIDGCTPIQTFFKVVLPIAKPTCVTVTILQAMWIWNDYLLPSLVLDQRKYKTVPMAVQYLKGGYGSVDMGAMMGTLVLAIVPIIIFYLFCQRYIIEGVVAGAVKGWLLFTPVSITPLIDTEDACFDLNASRPIAKGDLKWRDALLVAHRVNSNKG